MRPKTSRIILHSLYVDYWLLQKKRPKLTYSRYWSRTHLTVTRSQVVPNLMTCELNISLDVDMTDFS